MDTTNPYIAAFDPKEYLEECFAEPDAEYRFSVKFMVNALRTLPKNMQVLELGGGPTLYSAAMLAPYAQSIHFSDYVPASLNEVRKWLDNQADAFDWRPYIKIVLAEEGQPTTPEDITKREMEVRQKVTHLSQCDVSATAPLGEGAVLYDLVTAPHCTDVAANSVEEWLQIVQNISYLVAPGGWLFLSVTTGTIHNTVGPQVFDCVDLTQQDIYQGYTTAGFNLDTLHFESAVAPTKYEYSGASYAIAQKLSHSCSLSKSKGEASRIKSFSTNKL